MRTLRPLAIASAIVLAGALLGAAPVSAAPPPTVERIAGSDRFETSAAIAAKRTLPYLIGDGVIYVANGLNFPDALAAAPAAAFQDGQLLLTAPTVLPASVQNQIIRLRPDQIIVVGGETNVSASVYAQLASLAPNIKRIAGADRYETSRLIVADAFGGSITSHYAYVATGRNFPDALSAAATAGMYGSPVILVDGLSGAVDSTTISLLDSLGITDIALLGSSASMSFGIENSLDAQLFIDDVVRFAGADRYETSAMLNARWVVAAPTVFIATGENFADALSGAAYAGALGAPLYISPSRCLTRGVFEELLRLVPQDVVLLGSEASLGQHVAYLNPCDELE